MTKRRSNAGLTHLDAARRPTMVGVGDKIAGDASSYQYLAESIRMHPPQAELKTMFETAGFQRVEYFNLTGGIVAVHRGYRLK